MKSDLLLSKDKKITIVCRVEAGCLGPNGDDHVEGFCSFAKYEYETLNSNIMNWEIVPRYDKSQPEIQYKVNDKLLTHDKAERYLEVFDKNINDFEEQLHDKLVVLIDQYLEGG